MTDAPPTTGSHGVTDGRSTRESTEALPARLVVTATENDRPGAPGDYAAPSGVTEERSVLIDPSEENP